MSRRIALEPRYTAGGAFFVIEGVITDLDPAELASLVRQAVALAGSVGGPYEPPYVIAAELPYSDVDNDQQTLAYTWAVRFDDRAVADTALVALRVELERVGVWWARSPLVGPVVPTMPPVPEQLFEVADLEACPTVAAAVASLRASLVVHADLPLQSVAAVVEGRYWSRSGLTAEQRTWILGALTSVFGDVDTDDRPAGAVLAEALDIYIEDGASDAIAALERWVAGEDLTGGAWSG